MRIVLSLLLLLTVAPRLRAQEWNSEAATALVARAVARRQRTEADSGLRSYRATARGLVFFLAEYGRDPGAASRLVKADQLDVEVYWEAPNRSKQNVVAWRDRAYLPTDIRYHRDHLGIVTNDFSDAIRLGDGDEVRDAVHPLSPLGPTLYDFALTDSITIAAPSGAVKVYALQVRPRDPTEPRVAGTLYLDTATAATVQFRFSFTPAAYLQPDLEDISVVLEHALIDQRYWLPYRQEVEIRRRTAWLDVPFRTIIRGRWDVGDYQLSVRIPAPVFAGGSYGGLRQPDPRSGTWQEPIDSAAARVLEAPRVASVAEVREQVDAMLGARIARAGSTRLAIGSVSELARVNRVEGLAIGAGLTIPLAAWRMEWRPSLAIGTANGRPTGGLALTWRPGRAVVTATAERRVEDFSQWPVISGALNTLMAQEGGNDHGDWVGVDRASAGIRWPLNSVTDLQFSGGAEGTRSLDVATSPARGSYRSNPSLGAGTVPWLRAAATRRPAAGSRGLEGRLDLEAGSAARRGYVRVGGEAAGRFPLGAGTMRLEVRAGIGSAGLPSYRGFAIGGRGTLVGEPYRAFGGRRALLVRAEWQLPVSLPLPGRGSLGASQGSLVAPFVSLGAAGGAYEGLPWQASSGLRPVVGVASELLFNVFRIEAAYAPRAGKIGLTVDAHPAWWPIL
jgi:hypothetical protein